MQYESYSGTVNYEPNTLGNGEPREAQKSPTEVLTLSGQAVRQKISLTNDFQQAGERYRSLSKNDQDHLVDNLVDSLGKADRPIQQRMVANFKKADSDLAERIMKVLNLG